jgi:hypothetical protein
MTDEFAPPPPPKPDRQAQKPREPKPPKDNTRAIIEDYIETQRMADAMDLPTKMCVYDADGTAIKTYNVRSKPQGITNMIFAEFRKIIAAADEGQTTDAITMERITEFAQLIKDKKDGEAERLAESIRKAQMEAVGKVQTERGKAYIRILQLLAEPPKNPPGPPDENSFALSEDEAAWGIPGEEGRKAIEAWLMRDVVLQRAAEKKILVLSV